MSVSSRGNILVINGEFSIRFETQSDLNGGLVKEFGDAVPVVLRNIGGECENRSCSRMSSPERSEEDVIEETFGLEKEENWGKLSPKLSLEDKIDIVNVEDVFEARESRVDTALRLPRSFLSGFLSVLLKDGIEVVEEECRVRGVRAVFSTLVFSNHPF